MPLFIHSRRARVEVWSLERIELLAEEATELKKTELEIFTRLVGAEGGLGEIYNPTTAPRNRAEGYTILFKKLSEPGRDKIVSKGQE